MNQQHSPTDTVQNQVDAPMFAATQRLKTAMLKAGLEEGTVAFVLGRFVNKVANRVMGEVVEELADVLANPDVGGLTDDAARQKKIEELYKERTGKTIQERREEVADEMAAEFEKAGTQAV